MQTVTARPASRPLERCQCCDAARAVETAAPAHLCIGLQLWRRGGAVEELAHGIVLHPRHRKRIHHLREGRTERLLLLQWQLCQRWKERQSSAAAQAKPGKPRGAMTCPGEQSTCPYLNGVARRAATLQCRKHALQQRLGHPPFIRGCKAETRCEGGGVQMLAACKAQHQAAAACCRLSAGAAAAAVHACPAPRLAHLILSPR